MKTINGETFDEIVKLIEKCTQLTNENNRLKAELKHWTEREIITTEKK